MMAKGYQFRINVQPAEFYPGGVSVAYGVSKDCRIYAGSFVGTLAQALAELARVSEATPGPHAAFLGMWNRSDRVPPSFNSADRTIYKKGAE